MAFTPYQQRELVDDNEAWKQDSVNPPGEQGITAKPKWTPCQPDNERPQQRALHDGTFSREPTCSRDSGLRCLHEMSAQKGLVRPRCNTGARKRASPMRRYERAR